MRTKLARAENFQPQRFAKIALAAALGLAITFTLSCGGGGGGSDSEPESSSGAALPSSSSAGEPMGFCVYQESSLCLPGPFTSCPGSGGLLSNSCPSSSSVAASSSGTALPSSSSAGEPMAFCVYAATSLCLSGPYISCPGSGGLLSNSCPWVSSSSSAPGSISSSSAPGSISSSSAPGSISSSSAPGSISSSSAPGSISSSSAPGSISSSSTPGSISSSSTPGSISSSSTDTFTDSRDGGKVYKKVTIGSQVWMAQNLNHATAGSKCYGNSETNCATYGRLYDWATAMTACPDDWHLPTDAEWATLINYLGGSSTAGTKLKATSGWTSGNGTGTLGFSALPGGYGSLDGNFTYVGDLGNWWSATERNANAAYFRGIHYSGDGVNSGFNEKDYLFSVRCIQNSPGTFKDSRDGKVYRKETIGTQVWMAQNLNHNAAGSKCYDNSLANCEKYGRLYDWSTATVACPSGWHIPSDAEWTTLTNFAGGAETAGTELKARNGWNSYSGVPAGKDSYGFSALPGGSGDSYGSFDYVGDSGYWWSSTEGNAANAWGRGMYYYGANVDRDYGDKTYFFSVRCAQD